MHLKFSALATCCESINNAIGRAVSWLTVAVVVLMFANVALRYLFNTGAPWQVELVLALHAVTFLTSMGYTLQAGEQVRVDVLYARFSPRSKAWVNLLGTLLLLLPLCVLLMWFSWAFVGSSWALKEASSEYNGLQGIFLVKSFLLIGPALLIVQGIATILRTWQVIAQGKAEHG